MINSYAFEVIYYNEQNKQFGTQCRYIVFPIIYHFEKIMLSIFYSHKLINTENVFIEMITGFFRLIMTV